MKTLFLVVFVWFLECVLTGRSFDLSASPCPSIFKFRNDNGILLGFLKVNFPLVRRNKVEIEFTLVSNYGGDGKLSLLDTNKKVVGAIKNGKPVYYKLEFPHWDDQPKITKILINSQLICSGPPHEVYPGRVTRTIMQSNVFSIVGPLSDEDVYVPTDENILNVFLQPSTEKPSTTTVKKQQTFLSNRFNAIEDTCGVSTEINSLIFKGTDVPRGKYPWLSAMYVRKPSGWDYHCIGNLVSNRHAITAGHCAFHSRRTVRARDMLFAVGLYDIGEFSTERGSINVPIRDVRIHPDYRDGTGVADIAVVVFKRTIEFSNVIRPICIWPKAFGNSKRLRGNVAGWGLDETGELANTPKEATIPMVTDDVCLKSGHGFDVITSSNTFCAGARDEAGPCNGDSGSGFMVAKDSKWYLRGIVAVSLRSPTTGTCDLTNYIVFADVVGFVDWIDGVMKED